MTTNIARKIENGDALSTGELLIAHNHYKNLSNMLMVSGPDFRLAFKEANRIYLMLDGYKTHRGI